MFRKLALVLALVSFAALTACQDNGSGDDPSTNTDVGLQQDGSLIDDGYEDNDTMETAVSLEREIAYDLVAADDDWFTVSTTDYFQELHIKSYYSLSKGQVFMELYDRAGTKLMETNGSGNDKIVTTIKYPDVFTVHVWANNPLNYQLMFYTDDPASAYDDDYEDNDTLDTASIIAEKVGHLALAKDIDWYRITIPDGLVTLNISVHRNPAKPALGTVLAAKNAAAGTGYDILEAVQWSGDVSSLWYTFDHAPGNYYINIAGGRSSDNNSYKLFWNIIDIQ